MIGPRKRREIVGTFAKMYDHRFMSEFHAEHERHAERDALELCGGIDAVAVALGDFDLDWLEAGLQHPGGVGVGT